MQSALNNADGVAVGSQGAIFVADADNFVVRKLAGGTITTMAGTGINGYNGDGLPATQAQLNYPTDVACEGVPRQ